MEKKFQVFVSSTYEDLIIERQRVIQALLEMDCIPSGMELFPAADDEQWTLIKNVIDDCDYYLVIIGGRYGSAGPAGKSYTQMEYEYAISKSKPVLGFLHKDPSSLPVSKAERTDDGRQRLETFRALLLGQRICKFWTTPDELGLAVTQSLNNLKKTRPARGWVRAPLDHGKGEAIGAGPRDSEPDTASSSMRKYLDKVVSSVLGDAFPPWPVSHSIKSEKDGYSVRVGGAAFNIHFGQIESCEAADPHCVVALPANEFFDDECMDDEGSALGAYIQNAFPEQLGEVRSLVADLLRESPVRQVEKTAGGVCKSYGIAKCVFLNKPLSSKRKIILVSVTTKRAGQRLKAEPHYIFEAVKAINQLMSDHRLHELHLPLMGSGHGGLERGLALFYMVLAIIELLHNPSAHDLSSIKLVLFQRKGSANPEVPRETVERVLSLTLSMFSKP